MNKFGVFWNIVKIAGYLTSAAAAIGLAFMKRARWQPPEEVLHAVTARFAALLSMIVISLLYVFGERIGLAALAATTILFFIIAIVCLMIAIKTNLKYSFYYPNSTKHKESNRKLGGDKLTDEAERIRRERGRSEQQLFDDAQGDKDLVWTRSSQASVNVRSTLSFIFLIGFGTCSLAAAAVLVAVSKK